MSAPMFVGDATREPQLRIGVLTATLRHAKEGVDLAIVMAANGSDIETILGKVSADIADLLAAIAKADGT